MRDYPGKIIHANIEFRTEAKAAPNLIFDQVAVENGLGYDLVLNGSFRPSVPSVTFNFVIKGQGPICRLDINGTLHREEGRNHKHELQNSEDSSCNLPHAINRDDWAGHQTVREIWDVLCREANITHIGEFIEPGGWLEIQC